MKKPLIIFSIILICLTNCNNGNKSKKENLDHEPYKPIGLSIKYGMWNFKYSDPKTFSDFTIELSNKTNENFKMVRYRVKLFSDDNGSKREIFSKSYDYYERLNNGDTPALRDM